MSESHAEYAARAIAAEQAAAEEPLANARHKHLAAATTWHGLAKLAEKTEAGQLSSGVASE
jgi:hypothetical protein